MWMSRPSPSECRVFHAHCHIWFPCRFPGPLNYFASFRKIACLPRARSQQEVSAFPRSPHLLFPYSIYPSVLMADNNPSHGELLSHSLQQLKLRTEAAEHAAEERGRSEDMPDHHRVRNSPGASQSRRSLRVIISSLHMKRHSKTPPVEIQRSCCVHSTYDDEQQTAVQSGCTRDAIDEVSITVFDNVQLSTNRTSHARNLHIVFFIFLIQSSAPDPIPIA